MHDDLEIEFVRADAGHAKGILRLLEVLFGQEREFSFDAAASKRAIDTIMADDSVGIILLALQSREVVGMVLLLYTVSTALGGRVALLEDMVVDPRWRGHGIGGQLMARAQEVAQEQGCLRITLLTDGDNGQAHNFYQKHGFVRSTMVPFRYSSKILITNL